MRPRLDRHCASTASRPKSDGIAAGVGDDPRGDFLLEHQRQRKPLRRPCLARKPAREQRGAHVVGQVGDDVIRPFDAMRDFGGIAFDGPQLAGKRLIQFGQRWQAAAVHLDGGDLCAGAQQGAGQPAGAGADLQHLACPAELAGDGGDAIEQLLVEQEVLAQRLGGLTGHGAR
jgi:hypothetical protein